jgi:hypothetical protein
VARERTHYPDRILKQPFPQHGSEHRDERWWFMGHLAKYFLLDTPKGSLSLSMAAD